MHAHNTGMRECMHTHSIDPSVRHMAFGYETSHNAIKHDYMKQSLILYQNKKKKVNKNTQWL